MIKETISNKTLGTWMQPNTRD